MMYYKSDFMHSNCISSDLHGWKNSRGIGFSERNDWPKPFRKTKAGSDIPIQIGEDIIMKDQQAARRSTGTYVSSLLTMSSRRLTLSTNIHVTYEGTLGIETVRYIFIGY